MDKTILSLVTIRHIADGSDSGSNFENRLRLIILKNIDPL